MLRPTRRQILSTGAVAAFGAACDPRPMRVRTGLQRLVDSGFASLRGRDVGVLTNPSGVTATGASIVDVMHRTRGVRLRAVFGPEHGFRGTAPAGSSEPTTTDPRTGLTVYDLYGLSWDGIEATLDWAGVDTVVVDLQDVGARFYTYAWTVFDLMTAAAASRRRVVVLDRPNPLGGRRVAGPVMHRALESFVGEEPIAQQHGLTLGELAVLLADRYVPARVGRRCDLHVIGMTGWRRDRPGDMGGLRWIPPSPNIRTVSAALAYAGTCWFEGTTMSVGRGTTHPFLFIGAPYADAHWAADLTAARLPGVAFRPVAFRPRSDVHRGERCHGVQVMPTRPATFDAVHTALTMLLTARRRYPDFAWRVDAGDRVDQYWLDKLAGTTGLRRGVDAGHSAARIAAGWSADLRHFDQVRRHYLRY